MASKKAWKKSALTLRKTLRKESKAWLKERLAHVESQRQLEAANATVAERNVMLEVARHVLIRDKHRIRAAQLRAEYWYRENERARYCIMIEPIKSVNIEVRYRAIYGRFAAWRHREDFRRHTRSFNRINSRMAGENYALCLEADGHDLSAQGAQTIIDGLIRDMPQGPRHRLMMKMGTTATMETLTFRLGDTTFSATETYVSTEAESNLGNFA